MSTEYIGIVERNPWEGETFGFYFEHTPETEKVLRLLLARYEKEGDGRLRIEAKTLSELRELDDRDRNGYMSRVSVYKTPSCWEEWVAQKASDPIRESDPFWKGRGLKDLRIRHFQFEKETA